MIQSRGQTKHASVRSNIWPRRIISVICLSKMFVARQTRFVWAESKYLAQFNGPEELASSYLRNTYVKILRKEKQYKKNVFRRRGI